MAGFERNIYEGEPRDQVADPTGLDPVVVVHTGDTFQWIGVRRGGGGAPYGYGTGPADGGVPVVDGSTGRVIAVAHQDTATGQWEYVDPGTTVVRRVSTPGSDPGPSRPITTTDTDPPFDQVPAGSGRDSAVSVVDELHTRQQLRCPGSLASTVFLMAGPNLPESSILNPTNTGEHTVWLASFDENKQVIDGTKTALEPGQSLPVFRLAPGAKYIGCACGQGPVPGTTELTYSNPVS